MTWNDLGSWTAITDLTVGDHQRAEFLLAHETSNCSVMKFGKNRSRRYVLLGIRELIVVECDDVVMIIDRSSAQNVKKLVDKLRAKGWEDLL